MEISLSPSKLMARKLVENMAYLSEEDQLVLENIDEALEDDNKIVTYKWLSLSFGIPFNKAKSLLKYFRNREGENEKLVVIYFLGGKIPDSERGSVDRYILVEEEKLNDARAKFSTCSCEHIYSIQRTRIKDPTLLFTSDYDLAKRSTESLKQYGEIYFKENGRPPDQEGNSTTDLKLECLKTEQSQVDRGKPVDSNHPPKVKEAVATKKEVTSASFFGSKKSKASEATKTEDNETKDSETKKPFEADTKQQKKPELSFFGKPIKSVKTKDENPPSAFDGKGKEKETKLSESSAVKEENLLKDDFLPPSNTKKAKGKGEKAKKEEKTEASHSSNTELEEEPTPRSSSKRKKDLSHLEEEPLPQKRQAVIDDSESEDEEDFETFLIKSKASSEASATNRMGKGGKRQKSDSSDAGISLEENGEETGNWIKKEEKPGKKRKVKSSNTDQTEAVEDKDNEPLEEHSSNDKEVTTRKDLNYRDDPKNVPRPRKNRRRVLKSKAFVTEDGYMMTKKVYESESGSEESSPENKEEKEVPKQRTEKEMKATTKEKMAPAKHKMQSNLMSFFHKK